MTEKKKSEDSLAPKMVRADTGKVATGLAVAPEMKTPAPQPPEDVEAPTIAAESPQPPIKETPTVAGSVLGTEVAPGEKIPPEKMGQAEHLAADPQAEEQFRGKQEFHDTMRGFGEREATNRASMVSLDPKDPDYLSKLAAHQAQEGMLREQKAHYQQSHPWGSMVSAHPGIGGKIGHAFGVMGNIAGNMLAPTVMPSIPGSQANLAAKAIGGEKEQAEGVEQAQKAAQTQALTSPPEKPADWEVKEGQDAEGKPIMFRVNRGTGETKPLEGIAPKPAGGTESPLGDRIPQLNHLLASRFEIMNPGQPLPPEYTLPANATQKDYDRIEKALGAHENAASNQMQRDQLREMRKQTMQLASQKHDTEQDAIDAAAKALASGNLTNLRDIASMRGSQRLLIFQKALQLNPNFNTSEVMRKIRMMDSYQNGSEGRQLQSFGTFLEHAGELKRASEAMERSHAALLNKPLTWWKSNMADDPVFRAYLTALEPVGKEFESFLLAGRALYEDDRKQIKTLMDENTPIKSVNAVAGQMAKTAYDRYNEMAHRYKQTLKHDLREDIDPFSPAAEQAAHDLNLNLDPQAGKTGATSGKVVSLAAARQLPQNKGKSDDEIRKDIEAHGHKVGE